MLWVSDTYQARVIRQAHACGFLVGVSDRNPSTALGTVHDLPHETLEDREYTSQIRAGWKDTYLKLKHDIRDIEDSQQPVVSIARQGQIL